MQYYGKGYGMHHGHNVAVYGPQKPSVLNRIFGRK